MLTLTVASVEAVSPIVGHCTWPVDSMPRTLKENAGWKWTAKDDDSKLKGELIIRKSPTIDTMTDGRRCRS